MRTRRLLTKTSGKVHILSEASAYAYGNSDDCEALLLDFVQDFGRTVSVLGADGEEHFVQVHCLHPAGCRRNGSAIADGRLRWHGVTLGSA